MGTPLSCGAHISAIVPPPTLKTGLPNTPAKNLQIVKEAMLLENPEPRMKIA